MTGNALRAYWLRCIDRRISEVTPDDHAGYREAAAILGAVQLPDGSPGEARAMALAWLRARSAAPPAWVSELVAGRHTPPGELAELLATYIPPTSPIPQWLRPHLPNPPGSTATFRPCDTCGHRHGSAVCPTCGVVEREGPADIPCHFREESCSRCRSCFNCSIEFVGTRCTICGVPRGWAFATCRFCGTREAVWMPHAGHACSMSTLNCSRCESRTDSLCIC